MRDRTGTTLVEILIGASIAIATLAAVGSICRVHQRFFAAEAHRARLREAGRRVADLVTREIRGGGFDPLDAGSFDGARNGLVAAEAETIRMCADRHGSGGDDPPDGSVDPTSDECVGFSARGGTIYQATGRQVTPLTSGLAAGLRLRYFDPCEREIVPPPDGELGPAERASVRRVQVNVRVASALLGAAESAESAIVLRNREGMECAA